MTFCNVRASQLSSLRYFEPLQCLERRLVPDPAAKLVQIGHRRWVNDRDRVPADADESSVAIVRLGEFPPKVPFRRADGLPTAESALCSEWSRNPSKWM